MNMLRLDLKDTNETVLFVDPMKGVRVRKEKSRTIHELSIDVGNFTVCYALYDSKEELDTAYEYVIAKVNEYMFPQIESSDLRL